MKQIEVNNITLSYEKLSVINNLSFSVNRGDYILILGENGSGKSTLIKAILGIKEPKKGEIIFNNDLSDRGIGYLPQQSMLKTDFPATVYEIISSGVCAQHLFLTHEDKQIIKKNMTLLGIDAIKNRSFSNLSGGQKQKVLLARALCATKSLLILDEPTSALDSSSASEFYTAIYEINKVHRITIIIVSHDLRCLDYASHVLHLGEEIYFMSKSEYVKRGDINV